MTGIALLMVSLSNTAAASAYDSFPMDSGNFWIFDAPEGHRTIAVEGSDALGDGWFASDADGLLSAPVTVYDNTASDEMVVDEGADLSALFDFGAGAGDSWSFALGACDAYNVTAATDNAGRIMTPAGAFTGLSGFILEHAPTSTACDDAPLSKIKFASDVGPVSFEDAAGERGRLLYAFVGGEVAAASSYDTDTDGDLAVTFIVNDDEVAAGSVTVAAVLQNRGDEIITVGLPGGDRFIIDIFDRVDGTALGTVGLGDDGADTAMRIAPGAVKVVSAILDLSAVTGDLTLRATLQADDTDAAPAVDVAR